MPKTYSSISGAPYGTAVNLASATTTDLGAAAAPYLNITGTTTITGFGTAAAGTLVLLRFAAALTLTHNATSLILPGGANITTQAGDTAWAISEGSGNWRLIFQKISGMPNASGFTQALNTSSPNNTVNASSFTASGGTTNQDVVIAPKGNAALIAAIPDSTSTGGDKRGQYAVDLQLQRNAASKVASGNYAGILAGQNCTASGNYSVVIGGGDNVASGAYSLAGGSGNSNAGDYSVALGALVTLTSAADRTFIYSSPGAAGSKDISIASPDTVVFGNVNMWLANTNNAASELRFYEAQSATGTFPAAGTNYTAFKAGVQSADVTYTLPTGAPAANAYALVCTTGGVMSWSAIAPTGFTAALNTSSPNNTVNASSLTASGGTTNQDAVIAPKGTGALIAAIPDSSSAGGNKRGSYAVDLQLYRSTATQVASGQYSALIGGNYNTAAGHYSAVSGGQYNESAADYSAIAGGIGGKTFIVGQIAQAATYFSAAGDAQSSKHVLRIQTTNGTPTQMFVMPGTYSARLILPNDTTWAFSILVVARRTDADNESASYKFEGAIDRNGNAASTALVGSVTKTVLAEDTAAWDVTVTADTTNGALKIEVTGESGKTINWVAFVRTVETTG